MNSKFEKIYSEAVTNVMATGNNQTNTTINPNSIPASVFTDLKISPEAFQKIKQKLQQNLSKIQNSDQLFRLLANTDEEEIKNTETNQTDSQKGQTGGQNPTLDQVQKQQQPKPQSSSVAGKPLI